MREFSVSPSALMVSLWRNRGLIKTLVVRDIQGRYRGSYLGVLWSFATPLFMLAVYTFVFSVVFEMRHEGSVDGNRSNFAIVLFVGVIFHALLAEVLTSAPALILHNANYVKKVLFPLEILPLVKVGAALFHLAVSAVVLIIAVVVLRGSLSWTVLISPLLVLPFTLLLLGCAWMLAALGVYLRDIGHLVGILTTVMLFLAPIFYPLSAVPEDFQFWIMLNPLTFIVEQARAVLLAGRLPDWFGLLVYSGISCIVCFAGYFWFQKTRKGFADVI